MNFKVVTKPDTHKDDEQILETIYQLGFSPSNEAAFSGRRQALLDSLPVDVKEITTKSFVCEIYEAEHSTFGIWSHPSTGSLQLRLDHKMVSSLQKACETIVAKIEAGPSNLRVLPEIQIFEPGQEYPAMRGEYSTKQYFRRSVKAKQLEFWSALAFATLSVLLAVASVATGPNVPIPQSMQSMQTLTVEWSARASSAAFISSATSALSVFLYYLSILTCPVSSDQF